MNKKKYIWGHYPNGGSLDGSNETKKISHPWSTYKKFLFKPLAAWEKVYFHNVDITVTYF